MQQILEFPVKSVCNFTNFIVCDGNSAAVQFSRRVIDPDHSDKLLYLHGSSGSGKTHLLEAVLDELATAGAAAPAYFSFNQTITVEGFADLFKGADALVVDDLHMIPDEIAFKAVLWQMFNDFYISGRPIVLAGQQPPRELPHIDDHLISRLLWGLVARVDASDDVSRQMILKKVADDRQVRVPEDVVDYILMTTSREVGDLIRFFDALYRAAIAEKRRITLPLAREVRDRLIAAGMS